MSISAKQKDRYGIVLVLLAVALIGTGLYVYISFPFSPEKISSDRLLPHGISPYAVWYTHYFTAAGLILSLCVFFTGHFSYPRVHNLKVYLSGYLMCIVGLWFFGLCNPPTFLPFKPEIADGLRNVLYCTLFINVLLGVLLPSHYKYRQTRHITYTIVIIEAFILLMVRYLPEASAFTRYLTFSTMYQYAYWIGWVWYALIITLTIFLLKPDFYLGGTFAGAQLFFTAGWIAPAHVSAVGPFDMLMVGLGMLFMGIGIMVHWLTRMEHRIAYDPLLQIYNRDYCSKIMCEQSQMDSAPPFGIAMVDIDHFKNINDTHGHQAGDQVLYNVAQTVMQEIIPFDGTVCRYGGEELAVFFPQKSTKSIMPIAESIRTAVEAMRTTTRKKTIAVTVSIGVSHRETIDQAVIDVIHAADKALYKAKNGGRNQVKNYKTEGGNGGDTKKTKNIKTM